MTYGDGVYGEGVYGEHPGGAITGTLTATLPALTADLAGTYTPPPITGTLDATLPALTASFAGTYTDGVADITGVLNATLPPLTVTFSGTTTGSATLADLSSGRRRVGVGYAKWEPPIAPIPDGLAAAEFYDVAMAYTTPVTTGTQPTTTATEASIPRLRDRILMGGRDITFVRGVPTVIGGYQLMQPFAYGSASLSFPGLWACFGTPNWLTVDKKVQIQRVDAEGNIVRDHKGIVTRVNVSGAHPTVEIDGELVGPASLDFKPLPILRTTADLGQLLWRAATYLGVESAPRMGRVTGIKVGRYGDVGYLEYLQGLMGKAWERNGDQWTFMPGDQGVYRTRLKDRETVHYTCYADDANAVLDVARDLVAEPNVFYGEGITPAGMRVINGRYPGVNGSLGPFPGNLSEGDTGDAVVALVAKLLAHGLLRRADALGGFDEDVTEAVKRLQDRAGQSPTGVVNAATWALLSNATAVGTSFKFSHIAPLAQDPKTRRNRYNVSGAIVGRNPRFDRHVRKVAQKIDYGTGLVNKRAMEDDAEGRRLRVKNSKNWVGTLRIDTGAVIVGEHTPGDPIGDIVSVRDITPGENIWLPLFDDGTLFHITAVRVDGNIATLDIDTQARDAWAVHQVIERNQESRRDPAQAFFRRLGRSTLPRDTLTGFSEVSGILDVDWFCQGDDWTVIKVPAGDAGSIGRIVLQMLPEAEFAAALFGKPTFANTLRREIGDPFTGDGKKRWSNPGVFRRLQRDHGILWQAGSADQPGGYSPGYKFDPDSGAEDGSAIITGKLADEAGFEYYTANGACLFLAIYAKSSATLQRGRIMWSQDD